MNIPQRARELTEKINRMRDHAMIHEFEGELTAFAAEVERDALERAVNLVKAHRANWGLNPIGKGAGKVLDNVMAIESAIRALITTPTPERPDPTVALALLFQNLFHNWSDKTETAMIVAGLLSEEDAEPTPLGIEAMRIAKENECG